MFRLDRFRLDRFRLHRRLFRLWDRRRLFRRNRLHNRFMHRGRHRFLCPVKPQLPLQWTLLLLLGFCGFPARTRRLHRYIDWRRFRLPFSLHGRPSPDGFRLRLLRRSGRLLLTRRLRRRKRHRLIRTGFDRIAGTQPVGKPLWLAVDTHPAAEAFPQYLAQRPRGILACLRRDKFQVITRMDNVRQFGIYAVEADHRRCAVRTMHKLPRPVQRKGKIRAGAPHHITVFAPVH